MSTSVDQRNKGQPNQVPNGSNKDGVKDDEFDPYMQQPHQTGYSAAPMSSPGVSDHYMPNYYSPMSFYLSGPTGVGGEGAWSNGGETPMFSVGNYEYNGMFSGFTYPPFGWEVAGGDYWNAPGQGRKDNRAAAYGAEEYYRADTVAPVDGYSMNGDLDRENGMNTMESGMNAMNLSGSEKLLDNTNSLDCAQSGDAHGSKTVISGHSQAPKKASWASIASQPARPQPPKIKAMPRPPLMQGKQPHNMDIGTWENKNNSPTNKQQQPPPQMRQTWSAPRSNRQMQPYGPGQGNGAPVPMNMPVNFGLSPIATNNGMSPEAARYPVVDKLRSANQYNPKEFNLNPKGTRFFIIKSYSEDDIHRSIKYSIWCSTEHGNKRLDQAHREREGKGPIYLLFSVNGSGHFCGMAQMMSSVDYGAKSGVWAQDKWKGQFEVKWIYVKDVPNSQLRHIRLENNENKPVTNSRDTQEVPPEKGKQILKIVHNYKHTTSIFDDFGHYEKRQEEDQTKQRPPQAQQGQERQDRRQRQN